MNRRAYIQSAAASCTVLSLSVSQASADDSEDDELDCHTIESDIAEFSPDPDFIVSGEKSVRAYWKDNEWFAEFGYGGTAAVGVINGSKIVFNNDEKDSITDDVVMHELAHTLGYRHGDDEGIVDTFTPHRPVNDKQEDQELYPSTRDVATTFDPYLYCDEWSAATLGEIGQAFASGETKSTQLGYAATAFAMSDHVDGVYYKHSFNGIGGKFTPGYQPDPEHTYSGHFYGLPTV